MTKVQFELDGKQVEANAGETIWQVAKRQGRDIPHLCYSPEPDYRPDGNCRACMVEIEGERVLAASCKRTPTVGMKVKSESARAVAAQKMVMELLVADQPARETSHDPDFEILELGREGRGHRKPLPRRRALGRRCQPSGDARQSRRLHPVRAVRARLPRGAGQRRHRHGLSQPRLQDRVRLRRSDGGIDLRRLRRMRAGLPDRRADAGGDARREPDPRHLCRQEGGLAVPVLRRRLPGHLSGQGREGHLRRGPRRPGQSQPALRQGPFRLRLHPSPASHHEAAGAAAEREKGCQRPGRSRQSLHAFPRSVVGRGAGYRRQGAGENPRREGREGARRLRLRERIQRRSLSVPEAGAHRFRLQQCRSLHAAVPCILGGGADGRPQLRRGVGAVCRRHGRRSHHRDRRQPDREPSGRGDLHQERGQARRQADRDGSAPAVVVAPCHQASGVQAGQRRRDAERDAAHDHHRRADRPAIYRRLYRRL